jgi:hypothetical protein
MSNAYVVVLYGLLNLNLKLSSAKLSHFSDILRAFGAILYLLEPKGERSGKSVGLFYCLILSGSSYTGKVYLEKMDPSNLWKNKATLSLPCLCLCSTRIIP